MALPTFEQAFFGYRLGPRYNPARRATFAIAHWQGVLAAVARFASSEGISDVVSWAETAADLDRPCKADQDRLDALLCALVGYQWLIKPRADSIMIGDLESGYMISPASVGVRSRLDAAAAKVGVRVDGLV